MSSSLHDADSDTVVDHIINVSLPGFAWMIERISLRRLISHGMIICPCLSLPHFHFWLSSFLSSSAMILIFSCFLGMLSLSSLFHWSSGISDIDDCPCEIIFSCFHRLINDLIELYLDHRIDSPIPPSRTSNLEDIIDFQINDIFDKEFYCTCDIFNSDKESFLLRSCYSLYHTYDGKRRWLNSPFIIHW